MTLRLNGTTSGYVEIDSAATGGNNTIVLPSSNGTANQFLKNGSTAGTLGWSSLVEDASGRLLVGTAAASGAKVEVVSGADGDGIRLGYAGVPFGTQGPAIAFSQQNNSPAQVITSSIKGIMVNGAVGGEAGILTFNTSDAGAAPAERMRITSAGQLLVGGTNSNGAYNIQSNGTGVWGFGAYVNGSDERLKDNIYPLPASLDVVKELNPVAFQYKPEFTADTSVQPGFIAQELQTALAGQDYLEGVVQAGPEYLSVAYQALIPVLTKALQEAIAKIEALEAANAALETRLAALEAQQ